MSTATPVSICSNALLMLGDAPISSLDDNSDRARLASNIWPTARDYVLRRHPWNCAIKRESLNPDAQAPAFDFAYQYTLPGDLLRVLSVGLDTERLPYKVEGRKILCDVKPLLVRYVYRNEDLSTWDSALVWGMTQVMRAIFAYGITQSTSLEQLVETVMRDVLRQARATDGLEDEPDALDDSPLLQARYRGVR
jgi:hypothetical protein